MKGEGQNTNFMAEHGARATDCGYHVIPIEPCSKSPGRFSLDRWYPENGWTRFCERPATEQEIEIWSGWTGCGVGFACGKLVGIDIDLEENSSVVQVRALADKMLGTTPLARVGRWPRTMLLYRTEAPFPSVGLSAGKAVAIYALGKQFIGWGIHPVTGDPYHWQGETPAEYPLEQLPAVTLERVKNFIAEVCKLLPPEQVSRRLGDGRDGAGQGLQVDEPATIEAMSDALKHVPLHTTDSYDYWLSVGMALHAGSRGSADGLELWDKWSSTEARYDPNVCSAKWVSFSRRKDGVSAGTIFALAAREGWALPDGMFLFEREAQVADALATGKIDISAIETMAKSALAKLPAPEPEAARPPAPAEPEPKEEAYPDWLDKLDGGLRMFVDGCVETARKPQPWISLAAALATFGTVMGRRYAGPTGVRPNIYTIGLAGSSSGKNHPLTWAQECLVQSELHNRLAGSRIASGQGMIATLEAQPTSLYPLDEIDGLIRAASDKVRAPRHLSEIIENLLTFYTSSHSAFNGTDYANRKERPRVRIEQPSLSVFGVCTPDAFWGSLKSGSALDGTLGRMLIFESDDNYPFPRDVSGDVVIPAMLLDLFRAIDRGVEGHNHFPAGDGAQMRPAPFRVGYANADAREFARALTIEETKACRENDGKPIVTLLGRTCEQVQKLALIKAVARDPGQPQITLADMEWANGVYGIVVKRMRRAIDENIADTEHELHVKRVAKIIRNGTTKTGSTVTLSVIARQYQAIDSYKRRDILNTLVEAGQVEVIAPELGAGSGALKYRWVGNKY